MVVTKFICRNLFFYIFIFFASKAVAQDNLLKRKVTVNAGEQSLENVLMQISELAAFTFSYDAAILSSGKAISIHAREKSVKSTLDEILPENIDYRVSGNHLILLKELPVAHTREKKYTISGHVYNATNKGPLTGIIVYEVSSLVSAVTDNKGAFSITVPAQLEQLGLSFNNRAYIDTVIILAPRDQELSISLSPVSLSTPAKKIKNLSVQPPPVESISLVRQLVPANMMVRTQNMDMVREKLAQISFLPTIGSNLKMSGLIENKFSLNVLAGYSYAVNAFEMGGLFNITRKDVNGFQIAGLGNLVGENTQGIQIAGLFNHNHGPLFGAQISGINNILIDTLHGVQVSGINNILKGRMKGWQLAGINNITTENVDGVQIAGLTNIAAQNVEMLQIAGLFNHSKSVKGGQIAGLVNFAAGDVKGFQLAGIINKAKNVNAVQLAGIANISTDTVSGTQVGAIFNYGKYIEGSQVGLLNVSDSASGAPIGFISFVRKGFHSLELAATGIIPGNIAVKTGTRKFYNIFSGSYGSWGGEKRWSFGYGAGTETAFNNKLSLNFEYTAHWVNEGKDFQQELSLLNRLGINLIFSKKKRVSLSAGPSLNFWLSEWKDAETGQYLTQLAPYTIIDKKFGPTLAQLWIGGKVALHWDF